MTKVNEHMKEWSEEMNDALSEFETIDEKMAFLEGLEFEQKHGNIKLMKGGKN